MPDKNDHPENETAEPRDTTEGMGDGVLVDAATDEVLRLHLDMFEGPFEVPST